MSDHNCTRSGQVPAEQVSLDDSTRNTQIDRKTQPPKLYGLLAFFDCSLIVWISMSGIILLGSIGTITGELAVEKELQFPGLRVFGIAEAIVQFVLILNAIHVRQSLVQQMTVTPEAVIGHLFARIMSAILMSLWAARVIHSPIQDILATYFPTFIMAVVWIPYFAYSKRVKMTFSCAHTERTKAADNGVGLTSRTASACLPIPSRNEESFDENVSLSATAVVVAEFQDTKTPTTVPNRRVTQSLGNERRSLAFGVVGVLMLALGVVIGISLSGRSDSLNARNGQASLSRLDELDDLPKPDFDPKEDPLKVLMKYHDESGKQQKKIAENAILTAQTNGFTKDPIVNQQHEKRVMEAVQPDWLKDYPIVDEAREAKLREFVQNAPPVEQLLRREQQDRDVEMLRSNPILAGNGAGGLATEAIGAGASVLSKVARPFDPKLADALARTGTNLSEAQQRNAQNLIVTSAKKAAMRDVAKEAVARGEPSGVFGTTWLMSMSDVQKIVPSAEPDGKGSLIDYRFVHERDAKVSFGFEDDLLLIVAVTFRRPASVKMYDDVQRRLTADYGDMSQPVSKEQFTRYSIRQVDRFNITHILYQVHEIPIEQVLFYRTK